MLLEPGSAVMGAEAEAEAGAGPGFRNKRVTCSSVAEFMVVLLQLAHAGLQGVEESGKGTCQTTCSKATVWAPVCEVAAAQHQVACRQCFAGTVEDYGTYGQWQDCRLVGVDRMTDMMHVQQEVRPHLAVAVAGQLL